MSHHDTTSDPGHGEPGHIHDETWTGEMMATDDPGHGEPGHIHDETWTGEMMATDDPAVGDDADPPRV
jgi:hypothetical protein